MRESRGDRQTDRKATRFFEKEKIAQLKAKIQAGNYEIDYDAVADKMLQSEF